MRRVWPRFSYFIAAFLSVSASGSGQETANSVSAPNPATVESIDAEDRKPRLMIETGVFNSAIRAIALSPDGKRVFAAAGSDIRVWDIDSGELIHNIRGFQSKDTGSVNSLAIDPAGEYLAIGVSTTKGGYLRTCHLEDLDVTAAYWGDPQLAIKQQEDLPGISLGPRSASALTFTNDGKYLAFIATIKQVSDAGQFYDKSLYMFFDWQEDELHDHGDMPDVQTPLSSLFPSAVGSFFGTKRHYVIPGLQAVFDVVSQQNVDASVSPDLIWGGNVQNRIQSHYGDTKLLASAIDANLPKRIALFAHASKRDGKDVYECDVLER